MSHNGGRLQVNVPDPVNIYELPFLDACKMEGANGWTAKIAGVEDHRYADLVGADGYPTAMPPGGVWQTYQMRIYGNANEMWDLIYPSQHSVTMASSSVTLTDVSATYGLPAGHKRYKLTNISTSPAVFVVLNINSMSGSSWTEGVHLYPYKYKADYDAGEYFNPEFLAHLGYDGVSQIPFGIIRTGLGWSYANANHTVLYSQRSRVTDFGWAGSKQDARYYAGTASISDNAFTMGTAFPGSPASWTNGQVAQFYLATGPTFKTATTIAKGAVTTITCVGHGLVTNDRITWVRDAMNSSGSPQFWTAFQIKLAATGTPPVWTITKIDDDTFTIPLNSTGYTNATVPASFYKMITISDGTLSAKECWSEGFNQYRTNEWTTGQLITGFYHSLYDVITIKAGMSLAPGIPVEVQCALGNKLRSHIHFCIPIQWESAERTAFIQDVYDNLDHAGGLLAIFEISNEVWNSLFPQYSIATSYAYKVHGNSDPRYATSSKTAEMAAEVATIFGIHTDRYIIGIAHQNVGGVPIELAKGPTATADPTTWTLNKCDVWFTAPYCNTNFYSGNVAASNNATYPNYVTKLLDWVGGNTNSFYDWFAAELRTASSSIIGTNQPLDTHLATFLPNITTALASYTGRKGTGVQMWAYEGGQHYIGPDYCDGGFPTGGVTVQNVRDAIDGFSLSQQYADFLTDMLDEMNAIGLVHPSILSPAMIHSNASTWGEWKTNTYGAAATPAWTAIYNWNYPVTTPDTTPTPTPGGGGASHPTKIKHEKARRELQKKNQDAIEQTIRLAYQRLTGKVTEPPILQQEATPERLAVHAEKLAEQLVEKSKNSAKQRERNKAIIADLHRQANAIMQEEEEAIIMLLH